MLSTSQGGSPIYWFWLLALLSWPQSCSLVVFSSLKKYWTRFTWGVCFAVVSLCVFPLFLPTELFIRLLLTKTSVSFMLLNPTDILLPTFPPPTPPAKSSSYLTYPRHQIFLSWNTLFFTLLLGNTILDTFPVFMNIPSWSPPSSGSSPSSLPANFGVFHSSLLDFPLFSLYLISPTLLLTIWVGSQICILLWSSGFIQLIN